MTQWREEHLAEGIRLICGDCREVLGAGSSEVERRIFNPIVAGSIPAQPTIFFDVIVTDPPYGVGKDYGDSTVDNVSAFQAAIELIADCGVPAAAFVPVCRLYDMPRRPQWTAVWAKRWGGSGLLAYPIYPHWEALALFNVKGDYKGNNGHRSDVFHFAPVRPEGDGHPTPKPEDLMRDVVAFMRGNIVCDPFMGSGTTGVAAVKEGREFVGIEIERRWFDIACRRISDALARPRLFDEPAPQPKQEAMAL